MVQQNAGCFVVATAAPHDQNQSTRAGSVLTPDPILMSRTRTRVSKLRCIRSWYPQTNHAAAHPGLENPSWNLEFWSWILSSDVPTNATCRSTQWEHAFWPSISSYPALTALKLVPAAASWAIKPLVPLKALFSGANTVTLPRKVLFRSYVNPACSTTAPSSLSCGVAATASNKVVLQVLCMQQVDSIWFQVMIKLS